MKNIFLVIFLIIAIPGNAQFTVEMQDGNKKNVEGNLHFSQSADNDNWSVGSVYDGSMDLSQIKSITATAEADAFANKTCWVYGVDAPDFPGVKNVTTYPLWTTQYPKGEWMRYDYTSINLDIESQKLTWKENCGWYDCNKTYEYDGATDDNMCWAAAASNLLHWWLVNNKKYIDKYDADPEYGQECQFKRPSEVFLPPVLPNYASNKSEVFKFFINSFLNRAGWCSSGVNWFINGNTTNISAPFRDDKIQESFNGFFSDVFSKNDVIAIDSRMMTKDNFNAMMKQAFTENKAIGVVVYDIVGASTGMHSMTIWGAEFDEEGNVAYVYYNDNNLPDQDPNGASLIRFAVTYQKRTDISSDEEYAYFTQLPKPLGGVRSSYPISALILVDLRQDIWKKVFPDVE